MINIYVFYADIFWVNQFLLHTAILLLTGIVYKRPDFGGSHILRCKSEPACFNATQRNLSSGKRFTAGCAGASALGATLGTALLLASHSYHAYLAAECVIILPLMTGLTFGKCDLRVFLRRYAGCFGTAILLGGLVTALENVTGIAQLPFLSSLIAFLIAAKWIHSMMRHKQVRSLTVPVILENRGTVNHAAGFIDTGNRLREPYGGRAVHLLRASLVAECGITEDDFLGLIPYRALGSTDNLLKIYRVDALEVRNCSLRPAVIATADDELFYGKEYSMILNSEII